jgi:hypothetical protein
MRRIIILALCLLAMGAANYRIECSGWWDNTQPKPVGSFAATCQETYGSGLMIARTTVTVGHQLMILVGALTIAVTDFSAGTSDTRTDSVISQVDRESVRIISKPSAFFF